MGSRIMEGEEFFAGVDTIPSANLNDIIVGFGLHQFPAGISLNGNSQGSLTNGVNQGEEVVHTQSLNLAQNSTNETTDQNNIDASKFLINVIIEQRMVRFRYDSELNNRNFGKEVLAKIVVHGVTGKVRIRIHAVDDKKMKAHPFCLIGDKCYDGVYIEDHVITPENNECICKATPRIPKQKEHEFELAKRRAIICDGKRFPYITEEMSKDDYWTSNKAIKESKEILLMVEAVLLGENGTALAYKCKHSEPINNAKDGKKFEVHAVSPTTSSVLGSSNDPHYIILTADSYSPNESDIQVEFSDDGLWTCTAVHVKVIKNAIEFCFPGYPDSLSVEKDIYVSVYDKKKKLRTSRKKMILRPTDNDIIEHKRKKAFGSFTIPTEIAYLKTEERASCSASAPRKKHHLKKRGPSQREPIDSIDLKGLEETGILSLNVESPFNMSEASQSSNSSFSQQVPFPDTTDTSTSVSGAVPNTIPALLYPSGSGMETATIFGTPMPTAEDTLQNHHTLNNIAVSQNLNPGGNLISQNSTNTVSENSQNNLFNIPVSNNVAQSSQNAFETNLPNISFDISQQQAPSLNSLNNAQLQELFKLILANPSLLEANQLTQNQTSTSSYDPHDIQLEDLADFDQNDVEVDGGDVSSTTDITEGCKECGRKGEKCEKKEGKEKKKEYKSETKNTKDVIESQKKTDKDLTSVNSQITDLSNKIEQKEIKSSNDSCEVNTKSETDDVLQSDVVTSNVLGDVEEG